MKDASVGGAGTRWVISLLLAFAVFCAGLVGSTILVLMVRHQQHQHLSQVMDQRAQAVEEAVTNEFDRYSDTLSDLAVAVGAQSDLSARDFDALTARLNHQRLPGVSGVALVVPATDRQVAAVQERWRAAGNPDLVLVPYPPAREHLFAVLSHALDGASGAAGRDLTRAAEPTLALLRARSVGRVAMSPTYVLLKDRELPPSQQQFSFGLAAPVYGGIGTPDRGRFRGWILMGLRGGDFLVETMTRASQNTVAVSLFDASTSQTQASLVARTGGAALPEAGALERTMALDIGGRAWQLRVQPVSGTIALSGPSLIVASGAVGISVTLLLTALVGALSTSRDRALRRVVWATAKLQADLRRREQAEAELREREVELRAFAGVVAHDLKSPLTNLIGYGDILTEQHTEELGTTATGYIGKIVSNAGRMWTLIDDLLSYTAARDATLTREPVDLDGLLHNVIAERREGLSEQPQIEAGCLPTVQADPVLLRQVLDNLIGNAIKYVRPGATACIQVTAETVGEDWLITISDRGIGIDGADRADVFGAFHRARGSEGYPGTGLGLAISQRIIHRHGGQIGVSPNPAGGSRFWFTLPILNTAPPPSRPARSGSSPRELAGLEAS